MWLNNKNKRHICLPLHKIRRTQKIKPNIGSSLQAIVCDPWFMCFISNLLSLIKLAKGCNNKLWVINNLGLTK